MIWIAILSATFIALCFEYIDAWYYAVILFGYTIICYIPTIITTAVHIALCLKYKNYISNLLSLCTQSNDVDMLNKYKIIYENFQKEYHYSLNYTLQSFALSLISVGWFLTIYLPIG